MYFEFNPVRNRTEQTTLKAVDRNNHVLRLRVSAERICRRQRAVVSASGRARLRRVRSRKPTVDRPAPGKPHDRPTAQV